MSYRVDTHNVFALLGDAEDVVQMKPKEKKAAAAPAAAAAPKKKEAAAPAKKAAAKPAAIVGEAAPVTAPVTAVAPVKKSTKKVPEKLPEGAETVAKESSKKENKPAAAGKLTIQRPGQREFDRHSGTGRGTEQPKDGAGKGNWGKDTDPKDQLEATPIDLPLKQADPSAPVVPKEPNVQTVAEFLKAQKKATKKISLPKAAAAQVEEETVDMANLKPLASKTAPATTTPKKEEAKKPAAAPAVAEKKVDIKLQFYNKEGRRIEGEQGMMRGPRPARPFPAPRGEPVNMSTMLKEPVPAPKTTNAVSIGDKKSFPSL